MDLRVSLEVTFYSLLAHKRHFHMVIYARQRELRQVVRMLWFSRIVPDTEVDFLKAFTSREEIQK